MFSPAHLDKKQQQQHLCQPEQQGKTKRKRDRLPRPQSADVPGPRAYVGPRRPRSADVPGPRVCAGFSLSDPRALSGWPLLGKTAPPHLPAGTSRTTLTLSYLLTCLDLKMSRKQVIFRVFFSSVSDKNDEGRIGNSAALILSF